MCVGVYTYIYTCVCVAMHSDGPGPNQWPGMLHVEQVVPEKEPAWCSKAIKEVNQVQGVIEEEAEGSRRCPPHCKSCCRHPFAHPALWGAWSRSAKGTEGLLPQGLAVKGPTSPSWEQKGGGEITVVLEKKSGLTWKERVAATSNAVQTAGSQNRKEGAAAGCGLLRCGAPEHRHHDVKTWH